MSWTIQNFPLPSDAELQGIVAYVNENYLEYRQAKADTYTYGWGALNGDTQSLLLYSQALAKIERIRGEYDAHTNSDIVWNDGTTSFGITYLQYVVNLENQLAFREFGVKFGYGTTGDDIDTLGAEWNNYAINYYGGNDSVAVDWKKGLSHLLARARSLRKYPCLPAGSQHSSLTGIYCCRGGRPMDG